MTTAALATFATDLIARRTLPEGTGTGFATFRSRRGSGRTRALSVARSAILKTAPASAATATALATTLAIARTATVLVARLVVAIRRRRPRGCGTGSFGGTPAEETLQPAYKPSGLRVDRSGRWRRTDRRKRLRGCTAIRLRSASLPRRPAIALVARWTRFARVAGISRFASFTWIARWTHLASRRTGTRGTGIVETFGDFGIAGTLRAKDRTVFAP